jgi:hypothetical protein
MTAPATTRAPFWSDDFDMDLLKVIPNVENILGSSADVVLYTRCSNPTHGRLNHPVCWGVTTCFGFTNPPWKPEGWWSDAPVVECTFLELLRDVWSHSVVASVEGDVIFDGHGLSDDFMRLMYKLRGWNSDLTDDGAAGIVRNVQMLLIGAELLLTATQERTALRRQRSKSEGK